VAVRSPKRLKSDLRRAPGPYNHTGPFMCAALAVAELLAVFVYWFVAPLTPPRMRSYIVSWPARLSAGQVFSKPISTLDIFPTLCAAAGARIPERNICDGVSLLPFLAGENATSPHDKLFWKMGNMAAARLGDWKILISQGSAKPGDMRTQRVQLYDLRSDRKRPVGIHLKGVYEGP
jgi:hypothetical protein